MYIYFRNNRWLLVLLLVGIASILSVQLKLESTLTQTKFSQSATTSNVTLSDQKIRIDQSLSDQIIALQVGWQSDPPLWLQETCPDVMAHYLRFPSFKNTESRKKSMIPLQTSEFAARSVCTYSILQRWLSSLNIKVYLHAGSHLGAIVHGQNIPWDDDVDGLTPYKSKEEIAKMCRKGGIQVHPKVKLNCKIAFNAVKVWLEIPEEDAKRPTTVMDRLGWWTPFVDLFFYKIINNTLFEVVPNGNLSMDKTKSNLVQNYSIADYFPTKPYYFGGIYAMGPPRQIAERRYDLQKCKVGDWNHHVERDFWYGDFLDCDRLRGVHPFVDYKSNMIVTTNYTQQIFPQIGSNVHPLTVASVKLRDESWAIAPESLIQKITNVIPNLDKVIIDNKIAPYDECTVKDHLKVVEYNTRRGRWWQEGTRLMKDADITILSEMDFGMSRSDQQQQQDTLIIAPYSITEILCQQDITILIIVRSYSLND